MKICKALITHKPWGYEEIWKNEKTTYVIKRLYIWAGNRSIEESCEKDISLLLISGVGVSIEVNETSIQIFPNQIIHIPAGDSYRICVGNNTDTIFIETS